jgi:hypothetical protein
MKTLSIQNVFKIIIGTSALFTSTAFFINTIHPALACETTEVYVNSELPINTVAPDPRAKIIISMVDELIQKGEIASVKQILKMYGKDVNDEMIEDIKNKGIYEAISEAETDGFYNLIKEMATYKSIYASAFAKAVQEHMSEIMNEAFKSIDAHITKATPELLDSYYNELMIAIEKEYPGTSKQFNEIYYKKTGRFLRQ